MKMNQTVIDHIKSLRADRLDRSVEIEDNIQRDRAGIIKKEKQLKEIQEEVESLNEILKLLNVPIENQLPWNKSTEE